MYPYTIDQNEDYDLPIDVIASTSQLPLQSVSSSLTGFLLLQCHYCCVNIVFLLLSLHFAIGLLEKSDLDVVANELEAVSRNWYTLGQNLISTQDLDSIRTRYPHDKLRMWEMLSFWLEHYYSTTWSAIVAGVRSSGDSQLADNLHSKYCSSEFTTT